MYRKLMAAQEREELAVREAKLAAAAEAARDSELKRNLEGRS